MIRSFEIGSLRKAILSFGSSYYKKFYMSLQRIIIYLVIGGSTRPFFSQTKARVFRSPCLTFQSFFSLPKFLPWFLIIQPKQNNLYSHLYKIQWANFCELILFNWLLIAFFHFLPVSNQTSLFFKININQLGLVG